MAQASERGMNGEKESLNGSDRNSFSCFREFLCESSCYGALAELTPYYKLEVSQGVSATSGRPLIDVCFSSKRDGKDEYLRIGIQIEGNQYRRMAEMDRETAMKKAKEKGGSLPSMGVFEHLRGTEWFDYDYNGTRADENRTIFGHTTSMTQLYCQYNDPSGGNGNGKDPFVYQYYNLDSTNNTYEALFAQIKVDLALAKQVIEDNHL